jgi:hypothetical protein
MRTDVFSVICITTGSFVIWSLKGFKGSFDDEMVSIKEERSDKATVRFLIGAAVIGAFFFLLYSLGV